MDAIVGVEEVGIAPAVRVVVARERQWRRWSVGILFVVLVACIWALASVLVQYIYDDAGFDAPFFLTYTCTSLFGAYLPVWAALRACGLVSATAEGRYSSLRDEVSQRRRHSLSAFEESSSLVETMQVAESTEERVISHRGHLRLALIICPLWFLANWTYNESLDLTSVTSSTIISTTSTIWTYILSVLFANEGFRWLGLGGVALTFAGAVLAAVSDADASGGPSRSVWGDAVGLVGAIMYATYTTALKVYSPGDEDVSTPLMFGYMGLSNLVLLAPVVLAVLLAGAESLANMSWKVFGLLVCKGLLDNVLSDYLWMRAVLLTSPTVASVGLTLTVPIAFVTDLMLHGRAPQGLAVVGGLLVVLGFLLVAVSGAREDRERSEAVAISGREGAELRDDAPAVKSLRAWCSRKAAVVGVCLGASEGAAGDAVRRCFELPGRGGQRWEPLPEEDGEA